MTRRAPRSCVGRASAVSHRRRRVASRSTTGSARVAVIAARSATACRCSRSTPRTGARPASTRPLATSTSHASTATAPRSSPSTPVCRAATDGANALAALLASTPRAPTLTVDPDDVTIRMVGIGGTGVVTVAQVLGTAAMLDGYQVRGLDQIGLSQKAGPVVSDLHLTRGHDSESSRLGAGQADVLLVFDALVAASKLGVAPSDRTRTLVVGSTSATPPGAAITDPTLDLPSFEDLDAVLQEVTRPDHRAWI